MRYGTRTDVGKRWLPQGERPVCPVKIGYDFGLLYTAICPYDGDIFAMFLPNMDVVCFDIFQDLLVQHVKEKVSNEAQHKIALIMDRASCHKAATRNEEIEYVFFPPACPELNPVERFFKELRKALKSRVFHTLAMIENKIQALLVKYWENTNAVVNITKFDYFNTQ